MNRRLLTATGKEDRSLFSIEVFLNFSTTTSSHGFHFVGYDIFEPQAFDWKKRNPDNEL